MAKTAVADIIVPSIFAPYAIERTTSLSEVIKAGIAERASEFDSRAGGGGKTVDMPYWKEITGSSEVLSDSGSLTVNKITTGKDTAAINNRGKAWGVNDLVDFITAEDPTALIATMVGGFWARDMQEILLKILDGLFDATNGVLRTTHRLNIYSDVVAGSITDAMRLTGDTFIDGLVKLGDANQKIEAVAMHSDTEAFLKKRDLIDFVADSEGKMSLKVFQGRPVVVDDNCPKVAGANSSSYTTYLFGRGAFAWGEGSIDPEVATETNRDTLASDDLLVSRRRFILHPRGVQWIGTPAGASPTNTEFAAGTNWSKVYSDKNIRIIAVKHNNVA
jgi:hypothetical protein